jgi:hypothetical protein
MQHTAGQLVPCGPNCLLLLLLLLHGFCLCPVVLREYVQGPKGCLQCRCGQGLVVPVGGTAVHVRSQPSSSSQADPCQRQADIKMALLLLLLLRVVDRSHPVELRPLLLHSSSTHCSSHRCRCTPRAGLQHPGQLLWHQQAAAGTCVHTPQTPSQTAL